MKQGRSRRLILLIYIKRKPGPKLLRWHSKRRNETKSGKGKEPKLTGLGEMGIKKQEYGKVRFFSLPFLPMIWQDGQS